MMMIIIMIIIIIIIIIINKVNHTSDLHLNKKTVLK